jgi:hypothetical protein
MVVAGSPASLRMLTPSAKAANGTIRAQASASGRKAVRCIDVSLARRMLVLWAEVAGADPEHAPALTDVNRVSTEAHAVRLSPW